MTTDIHLKPLVGKTVLVTKKSGAKYFGTLYLRKNKNKIVLYDYAFNLNGAWMSPKHPRGGRMIDIEKIDLIEEKNREQILI
jgi:small nuclear ribonucleoprotein (snRNP)-like protein